MGGKSTSTSATKLNQISVQSSSLGLPITIGWGRARINCNLLWYGAFTAIPHTTKQSAGKGMGGGVSSTSYTYTASIVMGLCEGGATGIQDVRTVYRDKSALTLSGADLSLATGTPTQATWGYLTTKFPTQAINYSGIAYVYAQDYALNDTATLPNHSFEVDFAIQLAGATNGDADPRDIVSDFLTNTAYGVPGWPSGAVGNLSDWSLYCRANNLLLSPVLDSQQSASNILSEWMTATNSEAVWSEGVLKVGSYGDTAATGNSVTWTPNLTPAYDLTEDDFQPVDGKPVKLEIVDQSNAYNIVQVEFLDRANQYNTGIAAAQDLANITQYGRRKQDPTTLHCICDGGIAMHAAQLLLQRTLYMRERYTFTIPDVYALLEPMIDTVTLTTTTDELKLNRKQVRLVQITENADGTFACTAIGMDIGTASAALYSAHSASGYVPNIDIAPGSVSTPVLINAPTSLTGGAAEVWIAAASTNANWGGCEVWVSADNVQYHRVGTITAAARLGVSTATLASHVDPDTTNTLSVDLTASNGTLSNSNSANANIGSTLCLIGTEIVGYQTATLTSANHYGLTNLRRGLYGTTIASHASGQTFARLDEALFKYDYGSLALGTTIYVKLPSFNIFGRAIEDISTVTAYTVQLSPNVTIGSGSLQSFTLVNRENCFIDGRTVSKITGSNAYGDASVVSSESFIGGCMVGFQPLQTTAEFAIGLNTDPATDDGYTSLDYCWKFDGAGNAQAYESGTPQGSSFTYAANDVFQITYQGTTVTYLQNGTTQRTATVAANLQLWLDSAFKTVGGKATNVTFAGAGTGANGYSSNVVTLYQRAATAPTTMPSADIAYTFANQSMSPAPNNGWTAAIPSPNGQNLYAIEQLAYSNTPTATLTHGAAWGSAVLDNEGIQTIVVTLYQRAATAPSVPSGTLTYTYATGAVTGATLGSWTIADPGGTNQGYKIQALAVAPIGAPTASILTGAWNSPTVYSKNGDDGTSQFTLINRNGMTIAGRTVTKTGGTNATWDSSVISAESFTGGATMSFVPGTATGGNNAFYIGLNSDPLTDNSFSSIDYGIKIDEFGNATWSDSSGSGSLGTWAANSTTFQITYTGTTVVYSRNGVATHTTTGVSTGQTLFLDSSFYYSTAIATNITFAKAGADGATGAPGAGANATPVTNVSSTISSGTTSYQNASPYYIANGAVVNIEYDGSVFWTSGVSTSDINTWIEVSTNGGSSWTQIGSTHFSGGINSSNPTDIINIPYAYTGTGSTTTQFRIATQRATGSITFNTQGTLRAV